MTRMVGAARLHETGKPFQIDTSPLPAVRPTDVLVEVKTAGVVPNLRNVGTHYPTRQPDGGSLHPGGADGSRK